MGKDDKLSLGQKVVHWARGKMGQKVAPRGECYDLANAALGHSGALSASHYGKITSDADYVWGSEIDPKDAQPGDVLQFRDFENTTETTTVVLTNKPGYSQGSSRETNETTATRPHHTAIVESNDGKGKLTILEQNFQNVKKVRRSVIYWKSFSEAPKKKFGKAHGGGTTETTTTVTHTVSGTLWVYRPQEK